MSTGATGDARLASAATLLLGGLRLRGARVAIGRGVCERCCLLSERIVLFLMKHDERADAESDECPDDDEDSRLALRRHYGTVARSRSNNTYAAHGRCSTVGIAASSRAAFGSEDPLALGIGQDDVDLAQRLDDLVESGLERDGRELAAFEEAKTMLGDRLADGQPRLAAPETSKLEELVGARPGCSLLRTSD
jgi:hypothetical protein